MKGLVLNSGGIDSPVAAYVMGHYDLAAVHFDTYPYSSPVKTAEKITKKLSEVLEKEIPHYTVPLGESLSAFLGVCGTDGKKYTCIFCKRMMFRIAERIALKEFCDFLLTGENLGQVASQTLQNIYVTSRAVEIPIVRPLIGLDKLDVIALAEKIGTYNISIENTESCRAVPQYPAIKAQLEKILTIEARMHVDELVGKALERQ